VTEPTPEIPSAPGEKLPSERDWERSEMLETRPAQRYPELISDGAGLPFPPGALVGPPPPLDPEDPAAAALLAHLASRAAPKRSGRALLKRGAAPPASAPSLDGWRALARSDSEALFARGRPPQLLTATVRRGALRRWSYLGSSASQPLRATRDGIRASSWRLDPSHELDPEDTTLRLLVTEQAHASGKRADGRVLAPDIYSDSDELVLTVFVSPRQGFQNGLPNPETPVRVSLPHPVGPRRLIDGALLLDSA
jgi:hypothetical protein